MKHLTAAILALAFLSPINGGEPRRDQGTGKRVYRTPQAAFAALQEALLKQDFGALPDCVTSEALDSFTGGMIILAPLGGPRVPPGKDPSTVTGPWLKRLDEILK